MSECRSVRVAISGKVQGVGFRASMLEQARQLGISGWVRNLPDQGVEAVFTGQAIAVQEIIGWCHQGPPAANVQTVSVEELELEPVQGFEIRY